MNVILYSISCSLMTKALMWIKKAADSTQGELRLILSMSSVFVTESLGVG